ncbi:MAG: hypothetical protein ABIE92_06235 [bacterium]
MVEFTHMKKTLTLIIVLFTVTTLSGCKSTAGGANAVAADSDIETVSTDNGNNPAQPSGPEYGDSISEEDIYKLPLDKRSRKILEKFAEETPDETFNGGINFSEWINVDTLYPILKALDPPVMVTGACFRPTGIEISSCFSIRGGANTSSSTFSDSLQKIYSEDAERYKMSMEDSEFYFEEAYPKLQQGDVEFYAIEIAAVPQRLLQLWDGLPSVRFISPGKSDLFPPIIIRPETSLELVR